MSQSHVVLKLLRKLHLYLGVATAPALLFFAFTGALQTFSLHETTKGSSYKPPAWIAELAQLHKKQTTTIPVRKPRPEAAGTDRTADLSRTPASSTPLTPPAPAAKPSPSAAASPAPQPRNHLPMKIFFLLVAVGLFLSTLSGVYMAYRYSRQKLLMTILLAAGTIVPLLLLSF